MKRAKAIKIAALHAARRHDLPKLQADRVAAAAIGAWVAGISAAAAIAYAHKEAQRLGRHR